MAKQTLIGFILGLFAIISIGCTEVSNEPDINVDIVFNNDLLFAEITTDQVCLGLGNEKAECDALASFTDDRTLKHAVALGDIDGDGDLDAVFASDVIRADDDHFSCLNLGNAKFDCTTFFADVHFSEDIALGDIDGDGDLDAVLPTRILDPESEIKHDHNRVCLGDGRGRFGCQRLSEDLNSSRGVALGDVNADGLLDAIFANDKQNTLCLGQGNAKFLCQFLSEDAITSNSVKLGDINGDDLLDVVFANSKQNHICTQRDNLAFECNPIENNTDHSSEVALGDLNNDGYLDAVFANDYRQTDESPPKFKDGIPNRVCMGNGKGSFNCEPINDDEFYTSSVALGDLNGDGHLDAAFANYRSNVSASQGQRNRACFGNDKGRFLCADVDSQTNFSLDVAIGKINNE